MNLALGGQSLSLLRRCGADSFQCKRTNCAVAVEVPRTVVVVARNKSEKKKTKKCVQFEYVCAAAVIVIIRGVDWEW